MCPAISCLSIAAVTCVEWVGPWKGPAFVSCVCACIVCVSGAAHCVLSLKPCGDTCLHHCLVWAQRLGPAADEVSVGCSTLVSGRGCGLCVGAGGGGSVCVSSQHGCPATPLCSRPLVCAFVPVPLCGHGCLVRSQLSDAMHHVMACRAAIRVCAVKCSGMADFHHRVSCLALTTAAHAG